MQERDLEKYEEDHMGVIVWGSPASPGVLTGPARVVRIAEDMGRLERGEIAVVAAAVPRLAQLSATAGAIVCEAGGTLSNLATTAREAGLPMIVGARRATLAIQDGDWITVDGGSGMAQIHEGELAPADQLPSKAELPAATQLS